MKPLKILVYIIFSSILLNSCEKDIDFKSAEIEPKIVVNAVFTAGSTYKYVRIEKSRSILDDNQYFEALPDANVKLYEDGVFISDLAYTSVIDTFYEYLNYGVMKKYPYEHGYYLDTLLKIKSGSTYRLEILADGFNRVFCETTVPYPAKLNQLNLEILKSPGDYYYMPYTLKNKLSISDSKTESNYYRLYTVQNQGIEQSKYYSSGYYGYGYENQQNTEPTDTIIQLSRYNTYFESQDPVLTSSTNTDILGMNDDNTAFFTDELMGSGDYTLSYNLYMERNIDLELGEFIEVTAIVQNISRELYYYVKSEARQANVQDNPFAEPVPVYSNIGGGIGIFGSVATNGIQSIIGEFPLEGKVYIEKQGYQNFYY